MEALSAYVEALSAAIDAANAYSAALTRKAPLADCVALRLAAFAARAHAESIRPWLYSDDKGAA